MKKVVSMMVVLAMVLTVFPANVSAKTKMDKSKANLCVGETLTLKLTGAKGKVTWKSSKNSVATVSKTGTVTAKKTGNCNIIATNSGKKFKCNIKVKKLPKNYATVNGKKVKVGKTATFTYKIQSKKKLCNIMIHMKYDKNALQIMSDDNDRFKIWLCNTMIPDYMDKGKAFDLYELVGVDPKATEFVYRGVNCKKAKVVDKFKVKILKSGNYTIDADYYSFLAINGKKTESVKKKDCTITVTVK